MPEDWVGHPLLKNYGMEKQTCPIDQLVRIMNLGKKSYRTDFGDLALIWDHNILLLMVSSIKASPRREKINKVELFDIF